MDMKELTYLIALAEEGSISRQQNASIWRSHL